MHNPRTLLPSVVHTTQRSKTLIHGCQHLETARQNIGFEVVREVMKIPVLWNMGKIYAAE